MSTHLRNDLHTPYSLACRRHTCSNLRLPFACAAGHAALRGHPTVAPVPVAARSAAGLPVDVAGRGYGWKMSAMMPRRAEEGPSAGKSMEPLWWAGCAQW